jgi:hypothetical protein
MFYSETILGGSSRVIAVLVMEYFFLRVVLSSFDVKGMSYLLFPDNSRASFNAVSNAVA